MHLVGGSNKGLHMKNPMAKPLLLKSILDISAVELQWLQEQDSNQAEDGCRCRLEG